MGIMMKKGAGENKQNYWEALGRVSTRSFAHHTRLHHILISVEARRYGQRDDWRKPSGYIMHLFELLGNI